ncbi:MAG: DUF5681 domain-containing protein [Pseudomonadota bacterium]
MSQFKKGKSGNVTGRPKGAKGKSTLIELALKKYSDENNIDAKQAIVNSLIGQAIDGDTQSAKIIIERLSPVLKPVNAPINLNVRLPKEPVKRAVKLIDLSINGELLLDEVKVLLDAMKSVIEIKEFSEIEKRIEELENAQIK